MKKTGKLTVLLLIAALLCTVFTVVSSAAYETKTLTDSDCSVTKATSALVGYGGTGDAYLSYRSLSSPDPDTYNIGDTLKKAYSGDWTYLTIDFDLMTETFYDESGTRLYIMTRNNATTPMGMSTLKVKQTGDKAYLVSEKSGKEYEIPSTPYTWSHITLVLQIDCDVDESDEVVTDRSVLQTYLNGELIFSETGVIPAGSATIEPFRFQGGAKGGDARVCFDNFKTVVYGKGYKGDLTKLFEGEPKSLNDKTYADVAYNKDYVLPFGIKRVGVYNLAGYETIYDNVEKAFAAVKDGCEIKLYADLTDVDITNEITVDPNGFDFSFLPGNLALSTFERDGNTIYSFKKTTQFAYYTFYPNGKGTTPDITELRVPIGATPVYTGDALKKTYEDLSGYFVFDGWVYEDGTPVTAVSSEEVGSYFEVYPSYHEAKAPSNGKKLWSSDFSTGNFTLVTQSHYALDSTGIFTQGSNTYFRYEAVVKNGTASPAPAAYFQAGLGSGKLSDISYLVTEFDIATEGYSAGINMIHTARSAPAAGSTLGSPIGSYAIQVRPDNVGNMVITFNGASYTVTAGEWAHVTIAISLPNGTTESAPIAVYINGERLTLAKACWSNASGITISDMRCNPWEGSIEGSTVCIDNYVTQSFAAGYTGPVSNLFTDGFSLNDGYCRDVIWDRDYVLPAFEAVARVDGKDYTSVSAALAALSDGGTLELLADLNGKMTIDRSMTVKTNGFAFDYSCPGYDVTQVGNTYIFTVTDRVAYFTFYDLSGEVIAADVPVNFGMTPAPEVSFDHYVVDGEGNLLVFTGWTYADGTAVGKVTEEQIDQHIDLYPSSGTYAKGSFVARIYTTDGGLEIVKSASDIANKIASAEAGSTFVFDTDYHTTATLKPNGINIDLNGHTITMGGDKTKVKHTFFQITGNVSIYSSVPGALIKVKPMGGSALNSTTDSTLGVGATFEFSGTAHLTLGTVTDRGVTHDGDNLSWYGGCMVNMFSGNFRITIDGGHYFGVMNDYAAVLNIRGSQTENVVKNAEFYCTRDLIAFQAANGAALTVDNCKVYLNGNCLVSNTAGASGADPSGTVTVTNTLFANAQIQVRSGGVAKLIIGEGCRYASLGTNRTSLAANIMEAEGTATYTFSDVVTAIHGSVLTATTEKYTLYVSDPTTVVWEDGKTDAWITGTMPTHGKAGDQVVINGYLYTLSGNWIFKDKDGNTVTFDVLGSEHEGMTLYATDPDIVKGKQVFATLSYGETILWYTSASEFSTLVTKLAEVTQQATNGSATVTFWQDATELPSIGIGGKDQVIPVYVDLNGCKISVAKGEFLSVKGGVSYYIYSSRPGGQVTTPSTLAFNYSRHGSHFYIGTVTKDGVTYDGDNLTVVCAAIFTNGTYYQGGSWGACTYNIHVNGGTYYQSSFGTDGMFYSDAYDVTYNVDLKDATFFVRKSLLNMAKGKNVKLTNGCVGNMTVADCEFFFASGAKIVGTAGGVGTVTVDNSPFYGVGMDAYGYTFKLASGDSNMCFASFYAGDKSFTDSDGTVHTYKSGLRVASPSEVITVNWKSGGTVTSDYWLPGAIFECLIDLPSSIDPKDESYLLTPSGKWVFTLDGVKLDNGVGTSAMVGKTVEAEPELVRTKVAFMIYHADGTVTGYTDTDFLTLRNAVLVAAEGDTVVLHTDYEIGKINGESNIGSGIDLKAKDLSFDLNGHKISTGYNMVLFYGISSSSYVYSSKSGARIEMTGTRSDKVTPQTGGGFAFAGGGGAKFTVGKTKDGTTYPVDYLTVNGSCLVRTETNTTMEVYSITHLCVVGDNYGVIQFNGDSKMSFTGCDIAITVNKQLFGVRGGSGSWEATMTDCNIYTATKALSNVYKDLTGKNPTGVTITNSTIYCADALTQSADFPVKLGEGVRLNLASTLALGTLKLARIEKKTYTIGAITFTVPYELVTSANAVNVTWNLSSPVTEVWKKGEIPENDTVSGSTDNYIVMGFVCTEPLTEDVTIDLTPKLVVDVKSNLTLYSDFTYNLYLPVDFDGTLTINGVEITGYQVNEMGTEYWRYRFDGIAPKDAMKNFTVRITAKTSDGTEASLSFDASILSYAEAFMKTEQSEEAVQMIADMLAYIRAAHCYFVAEADRDTARIDALLAQMTVSTPSYDGVTTDLGDLSEVLDGASLSLDGIPAFAFRVKAGFTGTVEATYVDRNGNPVTKTLTFKNGMATDNSGIYLYLSMAVADFRKSITVTVTPEGTGAQPYFGTYNLDAYVKGITDVEVPDFAARLYAFSASAAAYAETLH